MKFVRGTLTVLISVLCCRVVQMLNTQNRRNLDFYQKQLTFIKMGVDEEGLSRFSVNYRKDCWYGPLEELALFNFKKIIDLSKGLIFTKPLSQYGSCSLDCAVDVNRDCIAAESVNDESALGNESNIEEPVRNEEL